jgi:WD40 repeat protein
MSFDRKIVVSG